MSGHPILAALLIPALLAAATPQQQLDAAKGRWAGEHARDYAYTVTKTCGRCGALPARITVRRGKPVRTPAGYAKLDTVPELLASVQAAISSHPYKLTVSFDSRTGVPRTLLVDERKDLVDDVTGLAVTGFRRT